MAGKRRNGRKIGPLRVALYLRCSTDDQAAGDYSTIVAQEQILREFVAGKGATIVSVIADDGRTGTNLNRPGWRQLFALASAGDIDAVAVTYLSRLARGDAFHAAAELLRGAGVSILPAREKFSDDFAGKIQRSVTVLADGLYPLLVGQWTRTKQAAMVASGFWPGGIPPYGIRTQQAPGMADTTLSNGRVRRAPRVPVEDPEAAAVVRRAFALMLEKDNLGDVQRLLRAAAPDRGWTIDAVRRLLSCRVLLGEIRYGENVNPDAFSPIVDRAHFDAVAALLARRDAAGVDANTECRSKGYRKRRGAAAAVLSGEAETPDSAPLEFLLRGCVFCACGGRMSPATANGNGGRVGYYACAKRIKFGTAACNSPASRINAAALHEAAARETARTLATPSRLSGWLRQTEDAMPGREELESAEADASRRLRANERQIRALLALVKKAGNVPLRSVALEIAALEEEGEVLSAALDAARAAVASHKVQRVNASAIAALWGDFGQWWQDADGAEEREALLRGFVDRVDVLTREGAVIQCAIGLMVEAPAPSGAGLYLQGVGPTSGTRRGMVRTLDTERDAARSNYEPATPLTPPGGRSTHPSEGATRRVRVTVPVAVATGKGGTGRNLSAKGRA